MIGMIIFIAALVLLLIVPAAVIYEQNKYGDDYDEISIIKWHPVFWNDEDEILEGVLPEDEEDIIIAVREGGKINTHFDMCCVDCGNEYYLDSTTEWTDVVAWTEIPEYRGAK